MNLQKEINDFKGNINGYKEGILAVMEKALFMDFVVKKKFPADDQWVEFIKCVRAAIDILGIMKNQFLFIDEAQTTIDKASTKLREIYDRITLMFSSEVTKEYVASVVYSMQIVNGMYLESVCPKINIWTAQIIEKQIAELEY